MVPDTYMQNLGLGYDLESIMCSSMTTLHSNMHAIPQFSMASLVQQDGAELI